MKKEMILVAFLVFILIFSITFLGSVVAIQEGVEKSAGGNKGYIIELEEEGIYAAPWSIIRIESMGKSVNVDSVPGIPTEAPTIISGNLLEGFVDYFSSLFRLKKNKK